MDLTVDHYDTFDDLSRYIHGSAVVIGLQLLPILEPPIPRRRAYAEDLGRRSSWRTSSATSARTWTAVGSTCRWRSWRGSGSSPRIWTGRVDAPSCGPPAVPDRPGPAARSGRRGRASRCCIRRSGTASIPPGRLYCGIVDEVEAIDYDVFARRVGGRPTPARLGGRCGGGAGHHGPAPLRLRADSPAAGRVVPWCAHAGPPPLPQATGPPRRAQFYIGLRPAVLAGWADPSWMGQRSGPMSRRAGPAGLSRLIRPPPPSPGWSGPANPAAHS